MNKTSLALSIALFFAVTLTASAQTDTLAERHPEYLPGLKVGDIAPDFTANDTLGTSYSLSSFRGKYVILDFWATWCGDCRREIPALKDLHRDVNAFLINGVPMQWISYSYDFDREAWKSMLRKENFQWLQVSNLKKTRNDAIYQAYKTKWIPAFFVIDPQGKVAATAITAEGLRKAIMELTSRNDMEFFSLWPQGVPSSNELTGEERIYKDHVSNVTKPTLVVYKAKNTNGLAILACPGGGYYDVWGQTEGHNLAQWYNNQGITYAVLKYRLPNTHKEVPLNDVHEAMRILRNNQEKYGFTKLGIQGCSAGGHLAATASTHFTSKENRPDFQILFYPVITFDTTYTHMGTHDFLIGRNAPADLEDYYSNEKQVTSSTPQAFIMGSSDDGLVPIRNSIEYYNALIKNGVSASMHIYPTGGHGWCGNTSFEFRSQWMSELETWLKMQVQH